MKKCLMFCFIILLLCISVLSAGATDKIDGYIYSTDILTYVNGKPIDGYNIGGRTVVVAEDLGEYGFLVEYDDPSRTLKIVSFFNQGSREFPEIERGECGKILGKIYPTDIQVYYNGILVKGYNLGGKTAICLEDLGDLTDSPNAQFGYSRYLGKSIWNDADRTISFSSYQKNEHEILGLSRVYHRFKDNVIYTYSDDFYAISEFSPLENGEFTGTYTYSSGTGVSKYHIKPLYFDFHGKLVPIGLSVANPNNTQNDALMFIENPEEVKNMIKTYKTPKKSYEEAVSYFENECNILKRIENDSYTVFLASHETEGLIFVYLKKDGGFVVDGFFSDYTGHEVNLWFDSETASNTVIHTVYPFAGPSGTTTMQYATDLDQFDYE